MLIASKITALKPREKPYKVTDGKGLRLVVTPSGGKLWQLKYRIDGREYSASFGQYPDVGLAVARNRAEEARKLIAQNIHPLAHKKAQEAAKKAEELNSFGAVVQSWIGENENSWKPYTLSQVRASMNRYVIDNKALASLPIRQVQTKDVRTLLQSIAKRTTLRAGERKKEAVTVARNVRSWIRATFDFAIERELAETDPTYALRNLTELKRPVNKIRHNKKLTPPELKQLLTAIDSFSGTRQTGIAIELLLLFFVRTGELRQARWEEFDLDLHQWRIPASRMKAGTEHTVPISKQAFNLLRAQQEISGKFGWVLPNQRRSDACMSATTINRALERMGFNGPNTMGLAAHGFRGTASTHLHELGFDSELVEIQLAHTPGNKVKATYSAAKFLPKRTEMMQDWADYLDNIRKGGLTALQAPSISA